MPVDPKTPQPLRRALEQMEHLVQSFKKSVPFTAPEAMGDRYINLQNGLASSMIELFESNSITPVQAVVPVGATALQFKYVNWRDHLHEYVIQPESVTWSTVGNPVEGARGERDAWMLHGWVITRDGDPRPEMDPSRRRSFELAKLQEVAEVDDRGRLV